MFKEFLIVVVLLDGIAIRYCTCCLLASVWPNLGKFLIFDNSSIVGCY